MPRSNGAPGNLTGNASLRLKIVGISDASILAEDRLRGGVKGGGRRTGLVTVFRSSSLFPGTFKGGVWVSELLGESVIILSLSLSDSSAMNVFWLRLLA